MDDDVDTHNEKCFTLLDDFADTEKWNTGKIVISAYGVSLLSLFVVFLTNGLSYLALSIVSVLIQLFGYAPPQPDRKNSTVSCEEEIFRLYGVGASLFALLIVLGLFIAAKTYRLVRERSSQKRALYVDIQ